MTEPKTKTTRPEPGAIATVIASYRAMADPMGDVKSDRKIIAETVAARLELVRRNRREAAQEAALKAADALADALTEDDAPIPVSVVMAYRAARAAR